MTTPDAPLHRVLVVDDDEMARDLLSELLEEGGFAVELACDGVEAWRRLKADGAPFDVLVADWVMPGLNGLELLRLVKGDPLLEVLPVVLQTGRVDREAMLQGIASGAYYYVTKPIDREMLQTIVRAAAADYARYRDLQEALQQGLDAVGTLVEGQFRFRTVGQAMAIAAFLSQACPEPERTVVGLGELLVNAVEHGNLGISYEEKSTLLTAGCWGEEVERRLALPEHCTKQARVTFVREPGRIVLTVKDEGCGFDWQRYLDVTPERALSRHGRGIAMARRMSFSRLEYHAPGNEVTAVVDLTAAPGS